MNRFYEKLTAGGVENGYEQIALSFYSSTVHDVSKKNNAITLVSDGGYPTISDIHGGIISMTNPNHGILVSVSLGTEPNFWTADCIIVSPITSPIATLISGTINKHVVVKNNKLGSMVGTTFYDCGFNLGTLKTGPMKLSAVGTGTTTRFFVNGRLVGTIAVKVSDDVVILGNSISGGEPFGSFGSLVISNRAKSDKEIAASHFSTDYARVS